MSPEYQVMYLRPTSAVVLSTNLQDENYPQFLLTETYSINALVIDSTSIYMSRTNDNTGNNPKITPLKWRVIGTTNSLAAFDDKFFTQSYHPDEITYLVSAPAVDTIAFANLEADEVVVELLDEADNIIESLATSLTTVDGSTWIDYWFNLLSTSTKNVTYVPISTASKIRIRIKKTSSIAKIGNIGLGMRTAIGCERYGTTVVARKVLDPFGDAKFVDDVVMSIDIDSESRISKVEELAKVGDKFTFYFFGYKSKETVCARVVDPESVHENFEESLINLKLEGIK